MVPRYRALLRPPGSCQPCDIFYPCVRWFFQSPESLAMFDGLLLRFENPFSYLPAEFDCLCVHCSIAVDTCPHGAFQAETVRLRRLLLSASVKAKGIFEIYRSIVGQKEKTINEKRSRRTFLPAGSFKFESVCLYQSPT